MDAESIKLKEKLKDVHHHLIKVVDLLAPHVKTEVDKANLIICELITKITKDEEAYEKFVEEELKRLKEKKDA